ncbi:MAG: DNA translocase FtsK [Spirochaetota bacterium]|jgi:S-DNA-T family DNA segregation ATPase FtsK/SpoIIIE
MSNRVTEILCVVLWGFAVIVFLSLATFHLSDYDALFTMPVQNILGPAGVVLAQILRISFGIASYFVVAILLLTGWGLIKYKSLEPVLEHIFAITFAMVSTSLLVTIIQPETIAPFAGGVVGIALYHVLTSVMGFTGAWIATILLVLISLILLGIVSISYLFDSQRFNSLAKVAALLYTKIVLFKHRDSIPLLDIQSFNAEKKLPWITRTKITLYGKTSVHKPKLIEYDNILTYKGDSSYYSNNHYTDDLQIINTHTASAENNTMHNSNPCVMDSSTTESKEDSPQVAVTNAVIELPQENNIQDEHVPIVVETNSNDIDEHTDEDEEYEYDDEAHAEEDIVARNIFEEIPINQKYSIPVDFLKQYNVHDETGYKQEIAKNSELLVNTLRDFGIESKVVNVNRGPVITLYELQIAPGIKVNRIVGLADDIAMALAASRVRVVAPIPGKKAIGVEIPNKVRETVTLKDIITSPEYAHQQGRLKVGLGKDIMGKPVVIDIKKLPHLLIAGATGAGKSVCVHSIITSLVYNYDPNYVRFIMVDPKLVELQIYNGIPHLLTPVIIEPFMVPKALKWTMMEMERRYYLLSEYNTRDIDRYNQMVERNKTGEYLPYIVIIMDELADLMMVAAKEIEGYITRIAQKARAVGIHLVLATQRPSVDIITGIIKANFPARIAFQVAQKTDSRTIIDQNGAEKLLGKGDMLYQSPMSSFPIRIQGAFISEDELSSIVAFLKKIAKPRYVDIEQSLVEFEDDDEEGEDELFIEAVKIVETTKKASASYLQRRLSIGYNRAARIIERMEELGYIGPQQGSKPREVYI